MNAVENELIGSAQSLLCYTAAEIDRLPSSCIRSNLLTAEKTVMNIGISEYQRTKDKKLGALVTLAYDGFRKCSSCMNAEDRENLWMELDLLTDLIVDIQNHKSKEPEQPIKYGQQDLLDLLGF